MPDPIPGQTPEDEIHNLEQSQEIKGSAFAEESFEKLEESVHSAESRFTGEVTKEQIKKILEINDALNRAEEVLDGEDQEELQLIRQKADELLALVSGLSQTVDEVKTSVVSSLPGIENLNEDDLKLSRELHHHISNLISGGTAEADTLSWNVNMLKDRLGKYITSLKTKDIKPYMDFYNEFGSISAIKGLSSEEIEEKAQKLLNSEALNDIGLSAEDFVKEYEKIRFAVLKNVVKSYTKAYYDFDKVVHQLRLILAHKSDVVANKGKIEYSYYEKDSEQPQSRQEEFKPLFDAGLIKPTES